MKKTVLCMATAVLALTSLVGCGKKGGNEDKYDDEGRLILNLKNVYFDTWDGSDNYTEMINEKFNVKIKASNYDYNEWDGMVYTAINGDNLTDAFHFNLKAYNFGSSYENWIKTKKMLKALPDDLSKWPNLQAMISNVSNVDSLKVDGKLYGIPIMNDISNPEKTFSNFTYVYRRDWAKAIDEKNKGKAGYVPVYKEGDIYTWEEFNRLCAAFKANLPDNKSCVLVDESWGFPSVTNFYKNVPHCFDKDENGKAINAFTCDKYVDGLEVAKQFVTNKYYSQDQFNFAANKAKEVYIGGQAGIFYDNFNLTNYIKFRKGFKKDNKDVDLDDGTAILRIKGPDGKYALEGIENWFSMTLFSVDISDQKLEKILDILDYLLSEEGTRLAIYGKEGYDYSIVDGKVVLGRGWEKNIETGEYGPKVNGAKYLRYMATLGNDTKAYDPYTEVDMEAYTIISDWVKDMNQAMKDGMLRIVQEPADIDWMSTPTKNNKTESILADANTFVLKYCFDKITTIEKYKEEFDKEPNWAKILKEINEKLGK